MSPEKVDNHQIIQEQNSDPKAAKLNYDGFAAKPNVYKKPKMIHSMLIICRTCNSTHISRLSGTLIISSNILWWPRN